MAAHFHAYNMYLHVNFDCKLPATFEPGPGIEPGGSFDLIFWMQMGDNVMPSAKLWQRVCYGLKVEPHLIVV